MKMTLQRGGIFLLAALLPTIFHLVSGLEVPNNLLVKRLGESFMVVCKDGDGNVTLSWSGPNGPLGPETDPRADRTSYGTTLYFMKVSKRFSGVYNCSSSAESKEVKLIIQDPLMFRDTESEQKGQEKHDITVRCEVEGGHEPLITWSIPGAELKEPKYQVLADGLLIRNLSWTDPKKYICKATQANTGEMEHKEITLKILHKPYPLPEPWPKEENVWALIGQTVNLTCEAIAEPKPKFDWYRVDMPVKKGSRLFNNLGPYISVLQLKLIDSSMFGTYRCKVSNSEGHIIKVINLEEGKAPPMPEFLELRGANHDLLDIGIRSPKNSSENMPPIKAYSIIFRVDGMDDIWKERILDLSPDNSYPLKYLTSSTRYEIKAASVSAVGKSEYTNSSIFETLSSSNTINVSYTLHFGAILVAFLCYV